MIPKFNLYWSKTDHEEAPYQKYDFSCNFKVKIDSKVPTPGPRVLKYGESNGDGLDPELECRKSKFSDRGTLTVTELTVTEKSASEKRGKGNIP